MKRKFLFSPALLFVLLAGCGAPNQQDVSEPDQRETVFDPATGTTYLVNPNRRIVAGEGAGEASVAHDGLGEATSALGGLLTDWSGTVAIQMVECITATQSGPISAVCSVDPSYVLIGGGARDDWTGTPGALLTESRPFDHDDSGAATTWAASSKDHYASANHQLHVWAVGLRLKTSAGTWMSHSALKSYVSYRVNTSPKDWHPNTTCTVPAGYQLIGGGARSNYQGFGQLLTASYPVNNITWYGASKDHLVSDPSTLDVYCIGLRSSIPGVAPLLVERINATSWVSSGVGSAASNVGNSPASVPVCYGGEAQYNGTGRLLYHMGPDPANIHVFTAASKDHFAVDSGFTTAWLVQLRKQ